MQEKIPQMHQSKFDLPSLDISDNPSNRVPWGPVRWNGYTLRGDYEPNPIISDPVLDIGLYLGEMLDRMPRSAVQGQVRTYYEGRWGNAKIDLQWLTEISFGETVNAIHNLISFLAERAAINTHPMHALITKDDRRQLLISVSSEEGESVEINLGHALELEAVYWPQRVLNPSDCQRVLAWLRHNVAQYGAAGFLPYSRLDQTIGNAILVLGVDNGARIVVQDLIQLLDAIDVFFASHGYAELYTDMFFESGEDAGFLNIVAEEIIHIPGTTNITSIYEYLADAAICCESTPIMRPNIHL